MIRYIPGENIDNAWKVIKRNLVHVFLIYALTKGLTAKVVAEAMRKLQKPKK
jgi:hypothetical protein